MSKDYKINFGIDGWRGKLDSEVNRRSIAQVAQAFADYLINNSEEKDILKVAVGYDGRRDSKSFAQLFSRILSANNIRAFLSDKTGTTPVLSYFVKSQKMNAGVMITASHLPPEFNGVKIKAAYGGPFLSQDTLSVQKYIGTDLIQADDEHIFLVDVRACYYDHLEKIIEFDAIKFADIKVLIDSMGGAGQQIIESVLTRHNITAKTIYKIVEPDFAGRRAEPIEVNLMPMREELIKNPGYSIGIATDGDADRLGVMTDRGEMVSSQEVSLLLADYVINRKKLSGDIVKTATITDRLTSLFQSDERKVIEVPFGFKFICEKMINGNIAFGCEESGGYGFNDHIPERDGILSGLLMVEMLAKSPYKTLSELLEAKRNEFGRFYFKRLDIKYPHEKRFEKLKVIRDTLGSTLGNDKIEDVRDYFDTSENLTAVKLHFDKSNNWLLIRISETEELFRIYAEAESESELNGLIDNALNFFK